jgi:hypothetical protein
MPGAGLCLNRRYGNPYCGCEGISFVVPLDPLSKEEQMCDLQSIPQPLPRETTHLPEYKLFKHTAVTLATVLGSVLAGAMVMAINFKRVGRPGAMWAWLLAGTVGLAAVFALPDLPGVPLMAYAWPQVFAMHYIAKRMLKGHLDRHLLDGGKLVSLWWAAGVGMIGMALCVPMFLAMESLTERSVQISPRERVIYSGTATAKEAMALGKALQQQGYFDGSTEADAELSKNWWSMPEITLVVGGEVDQEMTEQFRELGKDISSSVGELPLKLKLVNEYYFAKRTLIVR